MIADALRHQVELHAHRVDANNRLLRLAREGKVEAEAIGRYLVMLRFTIGNSPDNLRLAGRRAAETGRPDLASYFLDKLSEEDGHEQWAIDDLAAFEKAFGWRPEPTPVAAGQELQALIERFIETDPMLYVAYVFWAEYFVVLAGAEFAKCLVERCGLPLEALTCLTKHVALDEGHTDENIALVDRLVDDPQYLAPMKEALTQVTELFDRSTDEMLDASNPPHRVAS